MVTKSHSEITKPKVSKHQESVQQKMKSDNKLQPCSICNKVMYQRNIPRHMRQLHQNKKPPSDLPAMVISHSTGLCLVAMDKHGSQ